MIYDSVILKQVFSYSYNTVQLYRLTRYHETSRLGQFLNSHEKCVRSLLSSTEEDCCVSRKLCTTDLAFGIFCMFVSLPSYQLQYIYAMSSIYTAFQYAWSRFELPAMRESPARYDPESEFSIEVLSRVGRTPSSESNYVEIWLYFYVRVRNV